MTFDKINAELFDKIMDRWVSEEPDGQCQREQVACNELVEESRLCGLIAKEAERWLLGCVNTGARRRVLAGVFGTALRYGWHLRRLVHEREEIEGMMSDAEFDALRREIREA